MCGQRDSRFFQKILMDFNKLVVLVWSRTNKKWCPSGIAPSRVPNWFGQKYDSPTSAIAWHTFPSKWQKIKLISDGLSHHHILVPVLTAVSGWRVSANGKITSDTYGSAQSTRGPIFVPMSDNACCNLPVWIFTRNNFDVNWSFTYSTSVGSEK